MGLQDRKWFHERKQEPAKQAKQPAEGRKAARGENFWTGVAMAVVALGIAAYKLL